MTSPSRLYRRDNRGLNRAVVELVQRGHLIMDVSSAYLKASEATFGAFHPATWQFRNSLTAACRLRERLRAELGTEVLEAALCEPPVTTLTLRDEAEGSPRVRLIVIRGKTYCAKQVAGTELSPIQWRLTRLCPPLEDGPYYVCWLANGSTQCDCASGRTGLQRPGTAATRTANTWRRLPRWAGFDGTDWPVGKYFSRVRFAQRIACRSF